MNEEDRPRKHPSIETAVLGTEAVLYDERSGMVHHLNPTAHAIWGLLDGRPIGDVVESLSERIGVPPDDLLPDVLQAIDELRAAGLLAG